MLEKELHFERDLFFLLNGSDSTFWDNFFYICTTKQTWIIFYISFLTLFIYRIIHKKNDWKEIVCVLIAIGVLILLTDQISSSCFKSFFKRFRPTHHPDFMNDVKIVFNYTGGRYGFISSHAANTFGFAAFSALIFRNKLFTFTIFLFAFLISYSRIYIGVHFLSDVVVGAFVGMLIALFIYLLFNWVRRRWLLIEPDQLKMPICSKREAYVICGVFSLCIIIILVFNNQLITLIQLLKK